MKKFYKTKNSLILTSLAGLFMLTLTGYTGTNRVYAEPFVSDPVVIHCRTLGLSKAASRACEDRLVINNIRLAALNKCDPNASSDKKTSCVVRQSNIILDKAAASKPKTENSFVTAIDRQIRAAGGTPSKQLIDKFGAIDPEGDLCQGGVCSDPAADPNVDCDQEGCDFIKKYINPGINLFSIIFGLIAVISLIYGGILYSASGGDPQKVTQAKKRITDTIIAIVAYFFLYAFLHWLIPGGLFNR